jgi:retinoid hydroxylase
VSTNERDVAGHDATAKPLPPGASGLPLIGETLALVKDAYTFFDERFQKYGHVFRTHAFGKPMVCFVGPKAYDFFNTSGNFTREGGPPPHWGALLGEDALPFIEGEVHVKRRRILRQAFTPDALAGYLPLVQRVIERYVGKWEQERSFAWVNEFGSMCFDIGNALYLGGDPDATNPTLAAKFDELVGGMLALPLNLPFTAYGKSLKARDELRAYVSKAVTEYRPSPEAKHVLARMLAARDEQGKPIPSRELEMESMHFFVASVAVLKGTLCYLAIALAENPALMERARAEVKAQAPSGPITWETFKKLRFLLQLTREVRRLYKIVPSTNMGQVARDCEFEGYRLPKGWKAMAVNTSTHHEAKTFADPQKLDPARFAEADENPRSCPMGYVAHGSGTWDGHRCLGEEFADLVLVSLTALALRAHTWTVPKQDLSLKLGGLVPEPRGGLRVEFRRA